MQEVDVYPKSPERLTALIGAERAERLRFAVQEARQAIDGATVWHINATAPRRRGGRDPHLYPAGMAVNIGRKARASRRRKRRMAGRARPHQRAMDRAPNPWGGCACGATEKPLQRDCVPPLSRDGRYTLENVMPACPFCNTSKCNDEVTGWLRRKRLDERALLLRHVELRMALPLNVSAEPDAEPAAPETNREAFPIASESHAIAACGGWFTLRLHSGPRRWSRHFARNALIREQLARTRSASGRPSAQYALLGTCRTAPD